MQNENDLVGYVELRDRVNPEQTSKIKLDNILSILHDDFGADGGAWVVEMNPDGDRIEDCEFYTKYLKGLHLYARHRSDYMQKLDEVFELRKTDKKAAMKLWQDLNPPGAEPNPEYQPRECRPLVAESLFHECPMDQAEFRQRFRDWHDFVVLYHSKEDPTKTFYLVDNPHSYGSEEKMWVSFSLTRQSTLELKGFMPTYDFAREVIRNTAEGITFESF